MDHASYLDGLTLLTYAAALTSSIRLGVSVLVLPVHSPIHVAHRVVTLDYLNGGRAVLGVGLGRDHHGADFQVPRARRVRCFREAVELMKALWTEPHTYQGQIYSLQDGVIGPKPVQKPHSPIWLGGGHPEAPRRAAAIADGWMGAGGSSIAAFSERVPVVRAALEAAGRVCVAARLVTPGFGRANPPPWQWLGQGVAAADAGDGGGIDRSPLDVERGLDVSGTAMAPAAGSRRNGTA